MAESIQTNDEPQDLGPPAFLEPDPPHWVARGLAYLLVVVFLAGLMFSVFVQVPETVSTPFVLLPVQGTDPVRTARDGVVAEVRVGEGQRVAKGDILFVLHSTPIGNRSADLRALETQLKGGSESLSNEQREYQSHRLADAQAGRQLKNRRDYLTEKTGRQRAIRGLRIKRHRDTLKLYENEIEITKKEIDFKTQHAAVSREIAQRFEKLHKQGLVSWLDYRNRKLEASKLAVELQQLARQLDSAKLRVSRLEAEHEKQEIDWQLTMAQLETEGREVDAALLKLGHESAARDARYREIERGHKEDMDKAQIRITALETELVHSHSNAVSLPAPCSGTVLRLTVNRARAVVSQGDVLAELACSDGRLQADLPLSQAAVGRIKPGQRAKLLYDAYPYQRYGVRYGTVRWVSPATVATVKGSQFRALVDIDDESILIEGQPRPLKAGMRGTGRIVVGRRTLIAYAFGPLRQLRENLADAPDRRKSSGTPEVAKTDREDAVVAGQR